VFRALRAKTSYKCGSRGPQVITDRKGFNCIIFIFFCLALLPAIVHGWKRGIYFYAEETAHCLFTLLRKLSYTLQNLSFSNISDWFCVFVLFQFLFGTRCSMQCFKSCSMQKTVWKGRKHAEDIKCCNLTILLQLILNFFLIEGKSIAKWLFENIGGI